MDNLPLLAGDNKSPYFNTQWSHNCSILCFTDVTDYTMDELDPRKTE